jgi:hypothetical protein
MNAPMRRTNLNGRLEFLHRNESVISAQALSIALGGRETNQQSVPVAIRFYPQV